MALKFGALTVEAQAVALARLLGGGWLQLYGGDMPADADTPVREQPLLAEVQLDGAGVTAPGGEFQLAAKQEVVNPKRAGRATWFRCLTVNGRPVLQGLAGTQDADLLIERADLLPGHELVVTGFRYRQPKVRT
jgi:hypothetical protein